ncbi:MAG: O-antigen polymerase [Polaribacter sp.]|uniref:O-antigen polymerase n=1 Tax=Polaribacter sp. TaxID=1920175 RepID=UPI002F35C70A
MKLNDFILGLVLCLLVQFSVIEVHFFAYFLVLILFYSKISSKLFNSISFLVLILGIGCISSLFQSQTLYNFIKDLTYFTKPILAIITGYLIAKKIVNFSRFLAIIIYITFFFSIIHIINIVVNVDFSISSRSDIRKVGGISNISEVFVLIILIGSFKYRFLNVVRNKLLKKVILIITIISFTLYFSRTMIVAFIILLSSIYGYLKITTKGIKYGVLLSLFFGLFYVYLFSIDLDRGKPGLESFFYKMKIAPSEIFTPINKIDPNNHAYLWDHWRAYEATLAIEQMNTPITYFVGKGFGSLVDLKFKVLLGGDEKMRYIPVIHNGYVNIFFKTGIIGVTIYFLFLLDLYLFTYKNESSEKASIINNLIAGISIYFLFSSLIINGVYNIEEVFTFLLGSLFFFRKQLTKKINENRNNWY